MGKAREKLNENINKVLKGKNISRKALARSFYAYINEKIKELKKFVKPIKSNSWFGRGKNTNFLTENNKTLNKYIKILKNLELDPHYEPDETECYDDKICSEYANASGKLYAETVFIPIFEKDYKKYCDQKDNWNEKHIIKGKYHRFVNGLINFLFDELKETITDRSDISGFTVRSTLSLEFGISLKACEQIQTLFEEYVNVTKKEEYEHLIQVSGLTNEKVKEKIDTLIKKVLFASSSKEKKSDEEIIGELKQLSEEWHNNDKNNDFYSTLFSICMWTESLEKILKELLEIKSACVQMRTKQNQKT